ncbi:histidine phosphatase family protein [Salimicrobium humidisoli]|uniref:Histidine phosphatase family protein n=1 Tax=Salimicrobium humidisoli TaxID=2029857 RepID=A0ABX4HS99_9BACI|nr:histidine phosphatase family protein [Salimicrobium humidisoli]PBB05575.1 histidine phosphatase family protein [Salimicrobium humidisoli]
MLTNLYFVRHAHSVYTPDERGRPLSDRGLTDAAIVTELLKKESISRVVSSPYKRAFQTVEGIAGHINKDVEVIENLKERLLAGQPMEDFTAAITKVWEDFDFSWKGGESNRVAQQRGVDAVSQLLKDSPAENIVIGTHGNLMALIINYFDADCGFAFWKELAMPDIYKLSFEGEKFIHMKRLWS